MPRAQHDQVRGLGRGEPVQPRGHGRRRSDAERGSLTGRDPTSGVSGIPIRKPRSLTGPENGSCEPRLLRLGTTDPGSWRHGDRHAVMARRASRSPAVALCSLCSGTWSGLQTVRQGDRTVRPGPRIGRDGPRVAAIRISQRVLRDGCRVPPSGRWVGRGRGAASAGGARGRLAAGDQPLLPEHRPRQHGHGLQLDPRGVRRADARVRGLARCALPRDPGRQRDDRHRAGGACEAGPRPARRAGGADRHGGARRTSARGRSARAGGRRSGACQGRRPGRRRRAALGGRWPAHRRVDPHRRVRGGRRRGGRRAALRLLRGRGRGRLRRRGGGARELRRAGDRPGAGVPPPALAAGAGRQPAAVVAGRADAGARGDPRLCAMAAPRRRLGRGIHVDRGSAEHGAGGARAADEPHLRGRVAADGPPRRARPAIERNRVAGGG